MSWLDRLNPNKPSRSTTSSSTSFKPPSRSHSPGPPSVPKLTAANPRVVLSNDDDSLSPVSLNTPGTPAHSSLSPSPVLNGERKRSGSQLSGNSGLNGSAHRRAATTPAGPIQSDNESMASPVSQRPGASRTNLNTRESDTEKDKSGHRSRKPSNVNIEPIQSSTYGLQITDSPPQSIASRRSGSISSSENPGVFQPLIVDSPTSATHEAAAAAKGSSVLLVPSESTSKTNGANVKKRKSWRKPTHSPESSSSKKPGVRHQTTMGMGLASALAASGMGIMPSGPVVLPPQAAAAALAPPGQAVRRQSTAQPGAPSEADEKKRRASMDHRPRAASATSSITPRGSAQVNDAKSGSESDEQDGSSDDDDDDFDSTDALSFGDEQIAITGFAVATMKRNQDFHEMFPTIPADDYLIDDYGCALQREILIQGRLYISENHMCFHASIFGWVTNLIIPFYNVSAIEKKMTAFVIPNAIGVTEENSTGPATKHTFASFLARDTAFDVIYNIWKHSAPNAASGHPGSIASGGASVDEHGALASPGAGAVGPDGKPKGAKVRKATQCACSKNGQHYPNIALEAVVQGSPEQIYSLMFQSGFIKDFMVKDQKLMDIQISDWQPSPDNEHLLSRNMSYIKPLYGSFGPKQTKCELRDENQHVDFDEYISTITTTRTPDVPSGNVFAVKTRTCITWAGSSSTKITVSFTIEWTGRSFVKGIIEKSAGDGQRTYYQELEAAMRKYIAENRNEFKQEGVDIAEADHEAEVEEAALSPTSPTAPTGLPPGAVKPETGTVRTLQWALDTFEGAMKVATNSFAGALEIIGDLISGAAPAGPGQAGGRSTSILTIVIVLLVISNVYTITIMGDREAVGKRKALEKRDYERERWIEQAVKAVLQAQQTMSHPTDSQPTSIPTPPVLLPPASPAPGTPFDAIAAKVELQQLLQAAADLEQRVAQLNAQLKTTLDELD